MRLERGTEKTRSTPHHIAAQSIAAMAMRTELRVTGALVVSERFITFIFAGAGVSVGTNERLFHVLISAISAFTAETSDFTPRKFESVSNQ